MADKIAVKVEPIKIGTITVNIVGKTPLLMDKFPESTKEKILAKQTGLAQSGKKELRNINKEVEDAIHKTSKGIIGYPAEAFKFGMMDCTSFVGDKFFSKKLIQGTIKIINSVEGIIPIKYKSMDILKHNIQHTVKFSPQFHDWSCDLIIQYDTNNISPADIITLLDYAGFYCGIGAWRPKGKDGGTGSFGMYETKKK